MTDSYAYKDINDAWAEARPGQGFTLRVPGQTELVPADPDDPENPDQVEVPLVLSVLGDFLAKSTPAERAALGIVAIQELPPIEERAFKVTGSELVDVDGVPVRQWLAEPRSLDELKELVRGEIRAKRDRIFNVDGYTVTEGPLAGHVLQWRLAPHDDRTNWLTSMSEYQDEIDEGNGAEVGAFFRDQANVVVPVSFNDGLAVLKAMRAAGKAVLRRSWTLDAMVAAATSAEQLPTPEQIATGWLP